MVMPANTQQADHKIALIVSVCNIWCMLKSAEYGSSSPVAQVSLMCGAENPKILTQCNHHFHLACIYEWLERSQTCPICSRQMSFDEFL